ncbi:MAG: glutaredoxin family protein [Aquabacterium sp.]|jgi:glutaredoxin|nr:MAG: glutaredoxin family protein [Aquabacterium sp.]
MKPPISRRDGLVLAAIAVLALGLPPLLREYSARSEDALGPRIAAAALAGDIVMFTTTDCPYCAQARDWLRRHRVAHAECPTDTRADCAERFAALGGRGVPTLQVRGQVQMGFSAARVAAALGVEGS